MSKLSFRARALDASKSMPVYLAEEIPDLPDFAAINRSVPQMPTGMEKDEECEHHLQRAMSAQQAFGHTGELVIPTPEVYSAPEIYYNELYPDNFKLPRQLIHVQPFSIEHDIPDYDMDSEDEAWLNKQKDVINLTPLKFEEIMDELEKGSGQHVLTIKEAKLLLKEDDDLVIAVYDYWLNKRLRTAQALILSVKTERRDGTSNNNPYIAFRRRTEKMQTRKNRKNDEASYEKMLKLRRDLSRAVNLLQLVRQREKLKNDHLKRNVEIFEKRYHIGDFSGQILAEVSALRHIKPSSTYLPINNLQMLKSIERSRPKVEDMPAKRKREYKKRSKQDHLMSSRNESLDQNDFYSSDEEMLNGTSQTTSDQEDDDPDGPFAFKRKKGCSYHAPLIDKLGNWPWCAPDEGGCGDKRFRYCLTTLSDENPRCIGFARRRIGRGGRIIFDRAWSQLENCLSQLENNENGEYLEDCRIHFRPKTPPEDVISEMSDVEERIVYDEEGNEIPVVPITSLKEYVNENDLFSTYKSYSEPDLESFRSHQEELFEMQRKQLERLKKANESSANGVNINNLCNRELIEHSSSSKALSSSSPSTVSIPQPSSLDSARVQFAVSAVYSARQVTGILNSIVPLRFP